MSGGRGRERHEERRRTDQRGPTGAGLPIRVLRHGSPASPEGHAPGLRLALNPQGDWNASPPWLSFTWCLRSVAIMSTLTILSRRRDGFRRDEGIRKSGRDFRP